MSTCTYVSFYVLLNIFVKSVAEIELRDICLDSAFSFATDSYCNYFDKHEAEESLLRKGSSTCRTRCQIKLTSSNFPGNYLSSVSMVFDSYNYSRRMGCYFPYREHLTIDCSHLGKGQLGVFWNSDCKERNAECSKWWQLCVCYCDPEYSMTNGHCIQTFPNGDLASTQTENSESPRKNIGSIFGALFGGLLLGLIIATVLGFVVYRKFPSHFQNCADPRLMFAKKKTHNRDRDKDNIQQDKQVFGTVLLALLWSFHPTSSFICDKNAEVCETSLIAEHHLTMFHPNANKVVPYGGKLYPYNNDSKPATDLDSVPENEVIIANGIQRPVVVFNKTLPGPDIIVYEGQTVIIHVTNKMRSEVLGVHWHGLYQRNTPFMDGVPFITQCPILPGQIFTYKFQAYPKGTFWYYSTTGLQRIDGASGALIIRPKGADTTTEHVLQVQEWYNSMHSNGASLLANFGEGTQHGKHLISPDGAIYHSIFTPTSALINGKGKVNELPFDTFKGNRNNSFLFRTIATGAVLPFKISIDGHTLTIIEANGYRVKGINVESVILNPGERIVFNTNKLDSRTYNFWIRATTVDVTNSIEVSAILRYDENEVAEPKTSPTICSSKKPCKVFNCPFGLFPVKKYMECITADKVDSLEPTELQKVPNKKQFNEYFLNFEYPGTPKAAINGKQFLQPTASALTQPNSISTPCNTSCVGCQCTNSINLKHNDTVHFVLTNIGTGKGWGHPVHLHGHSFELLKMGFPTYNRITGNITTENEEIKCIKRRNDYCMTFTWSDSSWMNGNALGLNLVNPPLKDTVVIPRGGYVVIRIRANNPGLWLLHSLVDHQTLYGMSVMINESSNFVHQPPSDFPKCGNFDGIQTPLH